MAAKLLVDDSTMLVINGVPYSLVKIKNPTKNLVCESCDLQHICKKDSMTSLLQPICYDHFHDSGWYFVEDWAIIDKKIRDYIDIYVKPEKS